jgi:hypothetical protein
MSRVPRVFGDVTKVNLSRGTVQSVENFEAAGENCSREEGEGDDHCGGPCKKRKMRSKERNEELENPVMRR